MGCNLFPCIQFTWRHVTLTKHLIDGAGLIFDHKTKKDPILVYLCRKENNKVS